MFFNYIFMLISGAFFITLFVGGSSNEDFDFQLEFLQDTDDITEERTSVERLAISAHQNKMLVKNSNKNETKWPDKNPWLRKQFVGYHCWRLKHFCTPGGPRVCAYEPNVKKYVLCADQCTFHKINCGERMGYYKSVNLTECPENAQFVDTSYDPYEFKSSTKRRIIYMNETHTWDPPTRTQVEDNLHLFSIDTIIRYFINLVSNVKLFRRASFSQ